MTDEAITAEQARAALDSAAASRRRLLDRASPVSWVSQVAAFPMVLVATAFQDRSGPSPWWMIAHLSASAVAVAGLVLDRRRAVRLRWGASGPAGWLFLLVLIGGCYATWWAAAMLFRAASVPLPHTAAGIVVVAVILGSHRMTTRVFRWLALRRNVA
ncbi:hypothetical protein [Krasilnikovia sp. MM14-A1259]|uniref:hypothetical protein n=1 Tax=Krasilnikovia sp. MM14-A1259 TaxID=3373539 RepID=UPI003811CEF4